MLEITQDDKKLKQKNHTSFTEVFRMIYIIIYNLFYFAFLGIKFVFVDIWVALFTGASYQIDKTYRHVTKSNNSIESGMNIPEDMGVNSVINKSINQDAFLSEEERIYEKTKRRKKKEKVYKYSAKTLAKLEEQKKMLLLDLQTAGATRSKVPHVYYYKAKDTHGKIISGTMNGYSKLDINSYLLNEGYDVYVIKTTPFYDFLYQKSGFFGTKKMSAKDLIFWLTQLSTYIKAGITLSEAVKILTNQMGKNKSRQDAFKAISYELTLGESFSNALSKQGGMFPALLINMIKAAEASGTLIETLDDMANYYSEIYETKKQMISAMTYPAIVSVFSIGVIVFILLYVVPQFTEIYAENGAPIAGITKIVIDVSNFLKDQWYILFGIIFIIIIVIIVLYKYVKAFRTSMQVFLMHLPVIKDVIIYNEMTIFTKTFASLLRNNVFITDSMDILSKITNNEIYKAILYKTINNIVKGEKISEAFKDHWAVPDVAYYMIVTGESTGDLALMMQKVSEYYQLLHKNVINNLKAFIEPIMIAFLAVVVGLIIIAVIVPMFGMYEQIQ